MIRLGRKIYDLLSPLRCPVENLTHKKATNTSKEPLRYIIYSRFDSIRNDYMDNEYTQKTDFWQIDVYSKDKIQDEFIDELTERMEQGGFYYDNEKQQEYLEEIGTYWYAVRFIYINKKEFKEDDING